jgi:hypothetical protein
MHLETIVSKHDVMDAYEVDRQFPKLGHRTMLLNARKVFDEGNFHTTMLLGIEDITARRALEREREDLLRKQDTLLIEKDMLLKELGCTVSSMNCRSDGTGRRCGFFTPRSAAGWCARSAGRSEPMRGRKDGSELSEDAPAALPQRAYVPPAGFEVAHGP